MNPHLQRLLLWQLSPKHIGQETCRDHPIDRGKRRGFAEAGSRRQHLIAQPRIVVQGLEHAIAQERDDGIARVPVEDLLIGQPLQHRDLRPPGHLIRTQS